MRKRPKSPCLRGPQRPAQVVRVPLIALLTIGGITSPGCGGSAKAPVGAMTAAPVTIKFLRHDNATYLQADNAFFAEYTLAHPNVTIESTTVDFRTLMSTLLSDLKTNQFAFDLVLVPPSRVCSFADNLGDVPVDVASLAEAQNTFFAAPLAGSTCAGHLKGLPVEYNLEYGGVVVNLDKYRAKFPGKTPSWSDWQSFIADAAQLTEYDAANNPMANGLDLSPDWSPPFRHIFMSQILQRGGTFWSPTGTFDFSTPAAHDSLTAMVDWVTKDKVMFRSLVPDKNTNVTTRLAAGATGYGWSDPAKPLSVMGYLGTWGVPSITGMVPPGSQWNYEYFPLPPIVGTQHKFVTDSGWAFAVPQTSPNAQVAWDIAKSLALSPEAMRKWSATTGALPALRANGAATAVASNPTLGKVQPLLELGLWMGFGPAAAIDAANGGMVSNFFAAVAGTKSVDQALLDMQQTANTAIAAAAAR
jgi:multiple sugar transport system substrate-binding protein